MKKILVWAIVAFVAIQLIPINYENPKVNKANNFVDIYKTPEKIQQLLKSACYDCHSNETVYPSYSKIAPISWVIKDHVNEGRRYLNFSEWGKQTYEIKLNALEKSILEIGNYQMPLPSYISKHPESNLNKKDREELQVYFKQIEDLLKQEKQDLK